MSHKVLQKSSEWFKRLFKFVTTKLPGFFKRNKCWCGPSPPKSNRSTCPILSLRVRTRPMWQLRAWSILKCTSLAEKHGDKDKEQRDREVTPSTSTSTAGTSPKKGNLFSQHTDVLIKRGHVGPLVLLVTFRQRLKEGTQKSSFFFKEVYLPKERQRSPFIFQEVSLQGALPKERWFFIETWHLVHKADISMILWTLPIIVF